MRVLPSLITATCLALIGCRSAPYVPPLPPLPPTPPPIIDVDPWAPPAPPDDTTPKPSPPKPVDPDTLDTKPAPYEKVVEALGSETVDGVRAVLGAETSEPVTGRDGDSTHSWFPVLNSEGKVGTLRVTVAGDGKWRGAAIWRR